MSITTSKPGKHGEAKARIEAIGVFDGQKRSVVRPVKHKVHVPLIDKRNAQVVALMGDGGFLMNSQELETAVRLKIPVVVLLLNDNAYGFIKWKQQDHGFPEFGLDLGNPGFVEYAESYGVKGFRVESAADLSPTLEKAFACGGPALVECPIDYSENRKLWSEELGSIQCYL